MCMPNCAYITLKYLTIMYFRCRISGKHAHILWYLCKAAKIDTVSFPDGCWWHWFHFTTRWPVYSHCVALGRTTASTSNVQETWWNNQYGAMWPHSITYDHTNVSHPSIEGNIATREIPLTHSHTITILWNILKLQKTKWLGESASNNVPPAPLS